VDHCAYDPISPQKIIGQIQAEAVEDNRTNLVPIRPAKKGLDWFIIDPEDGSKGDQRFQLLDRHLEALECFKVVELHNLLPEDRRKRSKYSLEMWLQTISARIFVKDHVNKKGFFAWRISKNPSEQEEVKCVQVAAYFGKEKLGSYHTRSMRRWYKKVLSSGDRISEGHMKAFYRELTDDNSIILVYSFVE
jgi:hypothetical protein